MLLVLRHLPGDGGSLYLGSIHFYRDIWLKEAASVVGISGVKGFSGRPRSGRHQTRSLPSFCLGWPPLRAGGLVRLATPGMSAGLGCVWGPCLWEQPEPLRWARAAAGRSHSTSRARSPVCKLAAPREAERKEAVSPQWTSGARF